MNNSINLKDLSLIEELPDEQTINIMGGTRSLTADSGTTPAPSYPQMGPRSTPPPPQDEKVPLYIGFFTS